MSSAAVVLQEGLTHGYLSQKQEKELIALAKAGDKDAMAELIEKNEKLIYAIAFKAFRSGVTGTAELVDLQQLGRIGLMKAVIKYDASTGYRLSTYATWWIRQHVMRFGVAEGSAFSISHRDNEIRTRLVRCRMSMQLRLMRDVSIDEIAIAADVPVKIARRLLGLKYTSMDADFEGGETADPRLQIRDDSMDTEKAGTELAMMASVRAIIASMPESWQKVMAARFPLDGGEPMSYREIAAILDVSHQRVCQIEEQAMKVIRSRFASYP